MKKIVCLALLLLISVQSFSQDMASLKANAQKFYDYTINHQYEEMMDMVYPKLFDIAPKAALLETLKKSFEGNEGFKIKMVAAPPNFVFGNIKKIGDHTFSVISHDNTMQIIWDEAIPNLEIQDYIDMFKSAMKTENVSYDPQNKTMNIKTQAKMIAISDNLTKKQWKYLIYNEQIFPQIFDEKIKAELGL
ncbi:hypothetical protein ABH942_000958 [Flavobacterium sp. 28YEA47A]|uniref:hypothetical protein n=1 Tax=Flavobacterium sp. 28YEA47A TaxID=3156276 RepID=UPI003513A8D1